MSSLLAEQLNEQKRPLNQWSFVKYSHLKSDLQTTLLHLLERLEIASCSSDASISTRPSEVMGSQSINDLKKRLALEQSLTSESRRLLPLLLLLVVLLMMSLGFLFSSFIV